MSGTGLVACGTKHGSTRDVAHAVAETLQEYGLEVETFPAARIDGYRERCGKPTSRVRSAPDAVVAGQAQS